MPNNGRLIAATGSRQEQVGVQPPTAAVNVTLLAFAAERRAAAAQGPGLR